MDIYYQSKKFKRLLQRYEELRDNNISEFLDSEDLTDVAEYYYSIGQDEKALETANYTNHLYPTATAPLAFKARMALLTYNNPTLANEIAETIVDKSDLDYLYLKAEIMIADNQVSKADQYLQEQYDNVIDQDDHEEFVIDAAALFADYEEIDYAEKWLNQSTMINEDEYKEIKVRILKGQGKYEASETLINELIDGNPYSCAYWNQLTQIQFLRNDVQGAITSSEYALAINPNDEEALLNKANGLFSLDNFVESLKYYQRYFELTYRILINYLPNAAKDWTEGFAYLARCCYELKKTEEYKQFLQIAIERNPRECQDVLSDLYPPGTDIKDYPSINI